VLQKLYYKTDCNVHTAISHRERVTTQLSLDYTACRKCY